MIIDLKETNTKKYSTEKLIQLNAKEKISKLIVNLVNDIDNEDESDELNRVHNTILINGKRGMGKTSFILSMKGDKELMENLCPLKIIDPTLIETKEHVFLNIITSIKDEVEDFLKCKEDCLEHDSKKNWKKNWKKPNCKLKMHLAPKNLFWPI